MAARRRRFFRVYRRDSTGSALAALATATTPSVIPVHGWDSISVFCRAPTDGITITISQYLKGSSTAVATSTLTLAAAGVISQSIEITGELASITVTNGASQQTPEIIVKLIREG